MMNRTALLFIWFLGLVTAFAPLRPVLSPSTTTTTSTVRFASNDDDNNSKNKNDFSLRKAAASFAVVSTILANVAVGGALPAANAADMTDFAGTSQVVAARSGGRMGGRSYSSSSRGYSSAPRTRVYSSQTYVRPYFSPRVIISPGPSLGFGGGYMPGFGYRYGPTYPFGYNPYGYYSNPYGGFGLGLGLGATIGSQAGRAVQEYGRENQLAKVKAELQAEKIKAGAMEERIKQLEATGVDNMDQVALQQQQQQL